MKEPKKLRVESLWTDKNNHLYSKYNCISFDPNGIEHLIVMICKLKFFFFFFFYFFFFLLFFFFHFLFLFLVLDSELPSKKRSCVFENVCLDLKSNNEKILFYQRKNKNVLLRYEKNGVLRKNNTNDFHYLTLNTSPRHNTKVFLEIVEGFRMPVHNSIFSFFIILKK